MNRNVKRAIETHIDRETNKGLQGLPVPILELSNIARIAREAFAANLSVSESVRAYALQLQKETTK